MVEAGDVTQGLLDRAEQGDASARRELLERYRQNLRRLVAARLDRRVARRVDASDIVQEALTDAAQRMDAYLAARPLPFFVWLRRLTRDRMVDAHRRHLASQRRSVAREGPASILDDASAAELGRRLLAPGSSPSNRLVRQERLGQITEALVALPERDREVLVLWYLEERTTAQITEAIGITEKGVRSRHLRALLRLRASWSSAHDQP